MKLKKVHVREFWSVLDSTPFETGDITCLVGKNEAGKTAILQALYRLNPIHEADGKFNVTDDYPRSIVTDYEKAVGRGDRAPAVIVEAEFELETEEMSPIHNAFGDHVLTENTLTLLKGYQNKLDFRIAVDERATGAMLVERAHLTAEVDQQNAKWQTLKELLGILKPISRDESDDFRRGTEGG